MKKFLSLLLALTLVLSLVVVPARAEGVEVGGTYAITTSASSLARGDSTTFTVTATAPTVTDNGVTATDVNVIGYSWSTPGFSGAAGTGATTGTLTASNKAENVEVSCTLTIEYKVTIEGQEITRSTTKVVKSNVSIADKLLPGDITTVTFNNRTYSVTDGTVNISLLVGETIDGDNKWSAAATGYVIDNETNKPTYASGKLTVRVKDSALTADVTVNATTPTVTAAASLTEVISGGKTTLTASSTGLSNAATYAWFYKIGEAAEVPIGTGKSLVWTVPANVATATNYSVYCKASEGDKLAKTSGHITVKSLPDTYTFTVVPASVTLTQIGQTATLAANFMNTSTSPAAPVTPTYSFVSANLNIATVTNQTTAAPTVTLRASGSTTVTAKATYKGKDYVQNIHVTGALIEATLSAVQNGTSVNYSYSDLVNAAQAAINKTYSTAYTYETVYSLSGVTQVASTAAYGVGTSNASYNYPAGGSGYLYFKANLSGIGTAKFTATVTTRVANSNVPKTYSVTFNVPVTPSSTTYADQYPEPVAAYGNTYRYYVQVPSGARYYYVAGVNTEPVDWNNGSTQKYYPTTATANLYSLTDTNFINGKCTLYVVTQGTDNKLYCGTISVYQKNYNINYNGVAGETVQFAQSDFNDFMNKVAEARGDASKSKSYPYVTFDYVSFSLPTTAQGTLYYGGTAMSTSNSSGAFNTRTKVTNLDSVTFVPNDKTTDQTLADELEHRDCTADLFADGVKRFACGIGKKVLLANNIGLLWEAASAQAAPTVLTAWLGVIAYGFQIYFDFSGYSDMAIGLGRMLGFRFLENFNYPFLADSITDFWRRWHISMGTWFRDYFYIPLGGNKGGLAKQLRNIAIVWLLTGFWHGASWNFVLWGVYFGILLVLEKLFLLRWLKRLPAVLRHIYALVLVTISWTLFAFTEISKGAAWCKAMLSGVLFDSSSLYLLLTYGPMLAICALAATPLGKRFYEKLGTRLGQRALTVVDCGGLACVLVMAAAYLVSGSYNPFLYFRF